MNWNYLPKIRLVDNLFFREAFRIIIYQLLNATITGVSRFPYQNYVRLVRRRKTKGRFSNSTNFPLYLIDKFGAVLCRASLLLFDSLPFDEWLFCWLREALCGFSNGGLCIFSFGVGYVADVIFITTSVTGIDESPVCMMPPMRSLKDISGLPTTRYRNTKKKAFVKRCIMWVVPECRSKKL